MTPELLIDDREFLVPIYGPVQKFDPNQPRNPEGTSGGGRWVSSYHPRQAEVDQMQRAFQDHTRLVAPKQVEGAIRDSFPGFDPLRASDVRGVVKRRVQMELTERLLKHPAFAGMTGPKIAGWIQEKIDLWADTAANSVDAVKMQEAVRLEFGLDAATDHLRFHPTLKEPERSRAMAFVRAEYENTQAWFAKQGITHVSVLRGHGGLQGRGELGLGVGTVTMQPASSWTSDEDVAFQFTSNQSFDQIPGEDTYDTPEPSVITTRVPVSEILSTALTGRGALHERELIMLGKPRQAWVFDASREHTAKRKIRELLA